MTKRKPKRRKPYVWVFLTDWERDSWNGISYDGVERYTKDVPLQRIRFTVPKNTAERFSCRMSPQFVPNQMRKLFSRYKPPMRRRYLAKMRGLGR